MPDILAPAPIQTVCDRLLTTYPNATYELDWQTPEQLLIATILAAQTTDKKVNTVTAQLFATFPDLPSLADAAIADIEAIVKPVSFHRRKAQNIQAVAQQLLTQFGGAVPQSLEALVTLPGVARKTANVVLNCAFNLPSGIVVDTHVARVSGRLGLTNQSQAPKIEIDLMRQIPQQQWATWGPAMVLHGRYVCKAKKPDCDRCVFADICPSATVSSVSTATTPQPLSTPTQSMQINLGDWTPWLTDELQKPYFQKLQAFVTQARAQGEVFPPEAEVFSAFALTSPSAIKVLILGQDPYHDNGQAHGLSFSVKPGVKIPPSLRNMFRELEDDLGIPPADTGYLVPWAKQGVMLLNAVLTVNAHQANSHKNQGWEKFTDAVIRMVSDHTDHVVFVLWGGYARKKTKLIDASKHTIIESAHPSPLSARNGFFGSQPFSRVNGALVEHGQGEIDWQL
ncbi:MAG: uracil-DNA glycosylase [Spirulina sp. SIO3F2]|nr:uracil-DNA glycosylase [Spirulina sp. SIO3F2]